MNIKFRSSTGGPSLGLMPPQAAKLISICERIADGEVLDSAGLSALAGVGLNQVSNHSPFLGKVRHIVKGRAWHGNPKTIAELKKQFPK